MGHVGKDKAIWRKLGNLAKVVYKQEPLILHALGINNDRLRRYTRPVSDELIRNIERQRPKTKAQLNRIWYGYHNNQPQHYDNTRYHGVNLHNVWYRGTVEFRWFESTIHAGKIKAYLQFCLGIPPSPSLPPSPAASGTSIHNAPSMTSGSSCSTSA